MGLENTLHHQVALEGRAEVVCLRDMVKIWRVGFRCLGEKIWALSRYVALAVRRHQKLGTSLVVSRVMFYVGCSFM